MKKLLLLLLLVSPCCFADGPNFQHKDTYTYQEFENVYGDLKTKLNSSVLTTNTSGQILIGQGNGVLPVWTAFGRIIQIQSTTVTTSSTTTSQTFVPTNLTATITPTSSSSKILIVVNGLFGITGTDLSNSSFFTIKRGSTDLSSGNGFGSIIVQVSGQAHDYLANPIYLDSPASTNSLTYTINFRGSSASNTTRWNPSALTSTIYLIELGQ